MTLLDLDWRFLLPQSAGTPGRLVLLGAPAGSAESLLRLAAAEEVITRPTTTAGRVACLHGAGLSLSEAAALVEPGGALYFETTRRLLSSSPRSLRASGLRTHGLYWVHPGFVGPRAYVPLDARHALAWYVYNLRVPQAAGRSLASLAGRVLRHVAPRVAIVAAHPGGDADSPGGLFGGEAVPGALRDPDLRPLVLAHGDDRSRAILLPFAPSSTNPVAVVKLHRTSLHAAPAVHEHETLQTLRARLPRPLRTTVPEPLGTVRVSGAAGTVESLLEGEWLLARWKRRLPLRDLVADLRRCSEWLAEFHLATLIERRPWAAADADRRIHEPVAAYERAFGVSEPERALFSQLARQARAALGVPLPIVWQHSDFSSLNILRREQTIGVLDWDNAGPGLPLDDLLYFVTRWLYRTRDAEDESPAARAVAAEAFRELFFEARSGDEAVGAARDALDAYVRALELDGRLVPLLFAHAWIARSVGRLRHPVFAELHAADARSGNRYVTLVETTAEHAGRLAGPGWPWVAG